MVFFIIYVMAGIGFGYACYEHFVDENDNTNQWAIAGVIIAILWPGIMAYGVGNFLCEWGDFRDEVNKRNKQQDIEKASNNLNEW